MTQQTLNGIEPWGKNTWVVIKGGKKKAIVFGHLEAIAYYKWLEQEAQSCHAR